MQHGYGSWGRQQQEESIYNLIPRPAPVVIKPPMHISKHNAKVPPSCSTIGLKGTSKLTANDSGFDDTKAAAPVKSAATFGREVIGSVDPSSFLKKGAKSQPAAPSEVQPFKRTNVAPPRQGVPKKSEKPVMGLTTEKNFVVANAVENILAVPRRPARETDLATQKRDFAKVPKYLNKIKNDIAREKEYVEQMQKQQYAGENSRMREMTEEEKQDIMMGLKAKWDDVHKQFQSLTFSVDSVSKVNRKEHLESQLEQLEKAMEKLQKKHIHVYDDTDLW